MNDAYLSTRRLVGDVLFALLLQKWVALGTFLVTSVLILFFIFLAGPTYEGDVLLLVRTNPAQNLSPFADLTERSSPVQPGNRALDVVELAKSRDLAETIVREFKLDEREARRQTDPQTPREKINHAISQCVGAPFDLLRAIGLLEDKEDDFLADAVDEFLEDAQDIEVIEDTQVIKLTIGEESPELAMGAANRLADLVVAKVLDLDRREIERAHAFTTAQLPELETAYATAVQAVDDFRTSANVIALADEKSLKLNQVEGFRSDALRLRAQLAEFDARLAEIGRNLSGQATKLTSVDLHAKLVAQQADTALEREAVRGRLASVEASIASLEGELQALIQKEQDLNKLEQNRVQAERIYLSLKDQLEKLGLQAQNQLSEFDVRIADRAYISPVARPDWPMWLICLVIIVLVGGGAAVGMALLVAFWSDKIQRPATVQEQLGLPVLTPVPRV